MQRINHRQYLDQLIDTENILFADGVIGQIYFPNETDATLQNKIMETMEKLKCDNNEYYRIYDKRRLPERYHFSRSNRIGDIILDGQLGTIFYENHAADYNKTHDHGYDFLEEPMRTIFYAYGPNIARGLVLQPFQNIELFNLMIALLNVDSNLSSPPNNGTEGRLNNVLVGISINKPHRLQPLKECKSDNSESDKSCLFGLSLLISGNDELCYLSNCSSTLQSASIRRSDSTFPIALIERINSDFFPAQSQQENESAHLIRTSLSVKGTNDLQVDLHRDFVKGHFTDLEKVTSDYVKLYSEVVVISGPIYADSSRTASELRLQRNTTPSHIFRVIFRCKDSFWLTDEFQCENIKSLDALAFILPNVPGEYNCLDSLPYLTANTARLRDIELLTGLEFLPTSWIPEAELYDDEFSINSRTMMPEELWLEKELKR
uniref:NUC domain-containing protein n=1 Tax=Elaeophora elaphi TaxID=1147741 RepID=A0A0R3RLM0_9BILA